MCSYVYITIGNSLFFLGHILCYDLSEWMHTRLSVTVAIPLQLLDHQIKSQIMCSKNAFGGIMDVTKEHIMDLGNFVRKYFPVFQKALNMRFKFLFSSMLSNYCHKEKY